MIKRFVQLRLQRLLTVTLTNWLNNSGTLSDKEKLCKILLNCQWQAEIVMNHWVPPVFAISYEQVAAQESASVSSCSR